MEIAVMHGMARVWVKDYARKRNRELMRTISRPAAKPNDGKWMQQLARDMAEIGLQGAVRVGASSDGPMTH